MLPQVVRRKDGTVWVHVLDGDITYLRKKPIIGTALSVVGAMSSSTAAILALLATC